MTDKRIIEILDKDGGTKFHIQEFYKPDMFDSFFFREKAGWVTDYSQGYFRSLEQAKESLKPIVVSTKIHQLND